MLKIASGGPSTAHINLRAMQRGVVAKNITLLAVYSKRTLKVTPPKTLSSTLKALLKQPTPWELVIMATGERRAVSRASVSVSRLRAARVACPSSISCRSGSGKGRGATAGSGRRQRRTRRASRVSYM